MKTLSEDFDEFIKACYPEGVHCDEQMKQLHKAFFAGSLCTFQAVYGFAALPEKEAMKAVSNVGDHIMQQCKRHIGYFTARRN
jgi:hypothetical protein